MLQALTGMLLERGLVAMVSKAGARGSYSSITLTPQVRIRDKGTKMLTWPATRCSCLRMEAAEWGAYTNGTATAPAVSDDCWLLAAAGCSGAAVEQAADAGGVGGHGTGGAAGGTPNI